MALKKIIFLGVSLLLWSLSLKAQLTVSNSLTPVQLVQNVLLGNGVTATNITYNGNPIAIGSFNGSNSNIGLAGGVIMTSGNINNAPGPNNSSGASAYNGLPGDADLDQIMSPTHSYEACILEFDFVPTSDTVKFRYVFGSDEYMEYVSPYPGGINDGFGFFISGPGISGTFSNNAKNIALIPGTALPVTMFNLNLNSNGAYYFDNGNGLGSGGTAPNGTTVQYDGFTVVLTAVSAVQCGQTYHIKLAVGDGGDGVFDSGVFLEAGSFSSTGVPDAGSDISINQGSGCSRQLLASGFNVTSVTWNSIAPGVAGAYNSYLSCTSGCLTPEVTAPQSGAPAYVDYKVCGMSGNVCNPTNVCDTIRIFFNPPLTVSVAQQAPVLCPGQNSVSITATASGGSPSYNYLWNNINPSQTVTAGAGIYTVSVTDESGCPPATASVTVTSYLTAAVANAGTDQTVCIQQPAAILNGTVSGANGGVWSGLGTFHPNANGLIGITYTPTTAELAAGFADITLTTTGTGSCTPASDVVRINYVGFIEPIAFMTTPVSCFGNTDGSVTVSVSGTNTPYVFHWNTNPAQLSGTASNLSTGTYTVTIKNGIGCIADTAITITQPSKLSVASNITKVVCAGMATGSINLTVTGGTPPYSYNWSNGATTATISNLTAQMYSVTVTDANNCTFSSSYNVTEPSLMSAVTSATDVSCWGGSNGTAAVTVSGGTGPYTYSWSSGATLPNAMGLQAGTHTVTVTDFNYCTTSATVVVQQPATAVQVSTVATNVTCNGLSNGGAASVVSGGTPSYTYQWHPNGSTTADISNIAAGTYTLKVVDQKGCTATSSVVVKESAPMNINFVSHKNVSCKNGADGTVTASVTGGATPYLYSWSNGGTTAAISNLTAQIYSVTVTDNLGCTATRSVTITEPANFLGVGVTATNASCYGISDGMVASNPTGGTPPYSYSWLPGNATTQNVSSLAASTYTVTVRDTLGCVATNSATISQPTEIVLVTSSVNADCGIDNGQTTVTPSGGSAPYTYQWTPAGGTNAMATGLFAGAYSVLVTDALGCTASQFGNISENSPNGITILSVANVSCKGGADGSVVAGITGTPGGSFSYLWTPSGGTDSIATGLSAGSYTITITDNIGGCQALATAVITEPTPVTVAVTAAGTSCAAGNNGEAMALVSGGTAPYSYLWQPSGVTDSTITGLGAGTYTLSVTDAKNCHLDKTFTITAPPPLFITVDSVQHANCFGESSGAITVSATGGTPVYYYSWSPVTGNGNTLGELAAGIYTVTVTDFKGCTIDSSITINQPLQPLAAVANVSEPFCYGTQAGTVGVNVSGGTPVYSYTWIPAVSVNDTAFGLAAGSYTIEVRDTNMCRVDIIADVIEADEITGSLLVSPPSCGLSNGSVTAQVAGGISPYNYVWTPNGSINSTITNIGPGTYGIVITDSVGCTLSLITTTNDSSPVITVLPALNVSCNGGSDGVATVIVNGGTLPYSISWMPYGGNALAATGLVADTYYVAVTDATGCQITDSVIIDEPAPIVVSVVSQTDVLCNGTNTGSITVGASGGTGVGYTYLWSPSGDTTAIATGLAVGTHTVIVNDTNNCTAGISAVLTEPLALISVIDTIIHPLCFGGFGSATVNTSGGVLPYSYMWVSSGEITATADSIQAGSQQAIITDVNGCVDSIAATISQPLQVVTTVSNNDTLCLGQSTTFTATAVGGVGGYYYAWSPSGVINGGTLTISPTADITYTVIAYDQLGCPGVADTVSAKIYALTASNIEVYATTPICLGQSTSVSVETYGDTGPLAYQWNQGLGTGQGLFTLTPPQTTTYVVTVTNSCGLSISDSVTAYITLPPTVQFVSDSSIVCTPGAMYFTDSSKVDNPNDTIVSWLWNFGDGTTSTEKNPAHIYTLPGNYPVSLTVTTGNGCTNNNSTTPVTITGIPAPNAVFSANSLNLQLPGEVLMLNNQTTGASTYNWTFGDGGTSTAFSPTYNYTILGTFDVQLVATATNGCTDTAVTTVTVDADIVFPTAFTPNSEGTQGGAYNPNEMQNDIFFPYTTGVVEYEIFIYNRWGEVVFQSNDIKLGWDGYYKGKLCSQDVYVWKAYIKLNNGKEYKKNGNLTLLYN